MKNWNANYSGTQNRSVSSTDFNDVMCSNYAKRDAKPLYSDNHFAKSHCMSFADVNRAEDAPMYSRQQFSWRSPSIKPQNQLVKEQSLRPVYQRPFERAFKAAIGQMKESSINRLHSVNKSSKHNREGQDKFDDVYERNCKTLEPKRLEIVTKCPKLNHKIFRCNSTADRLKDEVSSINTLSIDCTSETESDLNDRDSKYQSDSTVFSNQSNQEILISNKFSDIQTPNMATKVHASLSGSRIIVPATIKSDSQKIRKRSRVISKAYISPQSTDNAKFTPPKIDKCSVNNVEDVEIEPLQSVQEIIAKVEALTFQNGNQNMSKSLIQNDDKSTLKKPHRTSSQKYLNGYPESQQSEHSSGSEKQTTGLYKKSNPVQLRTKSSTNMPFDFKKLHSAFLEQKQEIQNLKNLLADKKAYIIQLESELRKYEPWR